MFIECPNCNKKFEVDDNLIPEGGRLVQCGSCSHTWLYKKISQPKIDDKPMLKKEKNTEGKTPLKKSIKEPIESKNLSSNNKMYEIVKKDENKKYQSINLFKLVIVIFISFVAFIIFLDTFKIYISNIFPQINNILNSLYETLIDIFLFFKDLIK
tara:strand:- start:657 stop:1121 length:465 start_codon:yes stop_codon:yes gene_type:complete